MTVLQRNEGAGLDFGPTRKYLAGLAMAVLGVAAAFGVSQLVDTQSVVTTELTPVERAAAAAKAETTSQLTPIEQAAVSQAQSVREAEILAQRIHTGQVQQSLIDGTAVEPTGQNQGPR